MPLPHGICPLTAPPLPGTGPDCRALCAEGRCWGEGPQDCQTREYGARSQFCPPPPGTPKAPALWGPSKSLGHPPPLHVPAPLTPTCHLNPGPRDSLDLPLAPPNSPWSPQNPCSGDPHPFPQIPIPLTPTWHPNACPRDPQNLCPGGLHLNPQIPALGIPTFPSRSLPHCPRLVPKSPPQGPPPPSSLPWEPTYPPSSSSWGPPHPLEGWGTTIGVPVPHRVPLSHPPPPSNQQHLPRLPTLQGHEADGLLPRAVCCRLHRPQALRLPGVYRGRGAPGTGGYGMPESHTGCRPPPQGVLELQPERDLRAALSPPRHLQLGHLRVGTQPRRAIHLRCQLRQPVSL